MQTARVTVLMTPERKAELEAHAAGLGVSSGEYIRSAVDDYNPTASEEAELAALVEELNIAVPQMQQTLERTSERLADTHRKVDAMLREWGVRA
ncbi:hypothetical protein [uncultured Sphingomonas sp.]|uniref:plasmid mobilization protein n=1 Tax=uncultured Sphingomonas sp. TaxID=158754 RepID=UPI0035C98143